MALCFFAAVARAIDRDARAVIHRRHRHVAAGEDALPLAEWLVGGDEKGMALVAVHLLVYSSF